MKQAHKGKNKKADKNGIKRSSKQSPKCGSSHKYIYVGNFIIVVIVNVFVCAELTDDDVCLLAVMLV